MRIGKEGISLIVLIITIIIMIVLASAVVITLSNTEIINKASNAVNVTNQKEVQDLAVLIWADAYMENVSDIEGYITNKLQEQGVDTNKYTIVADKSGVKVSKGWTLKRTVTNGKVTKVVVKNGKQEIDVGTVINYMPEGVGNTNYKGGWKILGADEQGRLLILSNDSITGNMMTMGDSDFDKAAESYINALVNIQNAVNTYKDGKIGILVRSITAEDIDALTGFDKTKHNIGTIREYGNVITYSWDGTKYPKYVFGEVNGNLKLAHTYGGVSEKTGFTYYDVEANKVETINYIENNVSTICTLTNTAYSYTGQNYLSKSTLAYQMIFENIEYWLAGRFVLGYQEAVVYGMQLVYQEPRGVHWFVGFNSYGTCGDVKELPLRAVVTLAHEVELVESTNGIYNIVLGK